MSAYPKCRRQTDENSYLPITHPRVALAIKRGIDITGAGVALVITAPLLVLIAFTVKISSPGPVFYRGIRSGIGGNTFRIFKFRTMVQNAEQLGGATTGTNDPRITTVGKFLRKTKLDELPQFINVLKGEMSLVGPRPEVLEYTSKYSGEERLILTMRPGITDFASIEFADLDDRVGQDDPDDFFRKNILPRKNELRLKYVKEWNLVTDIVILGKTCIRIIKRVFTK